MQDWNIQSRSHECHECAGAFVDKQSYRTLLLHGDEEMLRRDLCANCWNEKFRPRIKQLTGFVSSWQGTYEAPPPPTQDAIQKDNAESLLRKLVERNDPDLLDASYILAVMLERKRIIKVKDEFRDETGRRVHVYEHPKTGDVFTIPDPNLHLSQLAEVQALVSQLMEHGLPDPAGAESPNESAADNPEVEAQAVAPAESDD
ncbi:MAG: hypothetical protein ISQ14_05705 [Verrucomicrobiae bacterium]|nr:hypothetical protein [Verrucomicrobiae bacterium]